MSPSCKKTLLPSHTQRSVNTTSNSTAPLEAEYNAADRKLLELEEELDVLVHYAHSIREKRSKMALGRLKHSDDGSTTFDGCDSFINGYLALVAQGTAIDDMIKALKEECAVNRSDCSFLREALHDKLRSSNRSHSLQQTLRDQEGLANGYPACGFADRKALAERIVEAESTATNVAGIVGAFGAGISYTTLFSATRGRLDLISWAFACFLIVVIDCTALQVFSPPPHSQHSRIYRNRFAGSVESRVEIYLVLIGIPLLTGFIFLGVSVAFLDNEASGPDPGSRIAIRASGFLPVAILGYFVLTIILFVLIAIIIRLLPSRLRPGSQQLIQQKFTTTMYPLKEKLYFLPGGPGYNHYRQQRMLRKK